MLWGFPGSLFRLPGYVRGKKLSSTVGLDAGLATCLSIAVGWATWLLGFFGWSRPEIMLSSWAGICFLLEWAYRTGSTASTTWWLRNRIRQNCQTSSLPWWDYWFSSVNGQKCYLRFLLRNAVHQYLRADCWQSPTPTPAMWLSLADSPSDPEDFPVVLMRQNPSGPPRECPTTQGRGIFTLGSLFALEKLQA